MDRLIDLILNFPKRVLFCCLLTVLSFIPGLLKLEQNYSHRNWFNSQDPALIDQDRFEEDFGSLDSLNIMLRYKKDIFSENNLRHIRQLTTKLSLLDHAIRVDSLTNSTISYAIKDDILIESLILGNEVFSPESLSRIKRRALADPVVSTNLIFNDNKTTLINFKYKKVEGSNTFYKEVLESVENTLNANGSEGLKSFHVLGDAKVTTSFRKSATSDLKILIPTLLFLVALLLFYQFNKLLIVLISFLSIIFSIVVMLGFAGYCDISFNNLTSITPELILAIGLADAIHIITIYALQLKTKGSPEALRYSLKKNFIPTIVTSLTTSFGFLAFINSDMDNIKMMGIIAAFGTVIAWLVTYFFLAPCILLFVSDVKTRTINLKFSSQAFIEVLLKNKKKVYFFYTVCITLSLLLIPKLEINSDPLKYFRGELDFSKDIYLAQEEMKAVFPLEIIFDSGKEGGVNDKEYLEKVESFLDWIYKSDLVGYDHSVLKVIKNMNKVFHAEDEKYFSIPETREEIVQLLFSYNLSVPQGRSLNDRVDFSSRKLRLTLMTKHMDSKAANSFYRKIREEALKRELAIKITGKRYLWHSLNEKVVHAFLKSLAMALLFVTLILTSFLKSVRLGLLSLIPNLIPIISGSVFLTILSRPLDIGSSIVASIVLGIAVDDTIHVISNYSYYLKEYGDKKLSLIKVFSETAPALIITTLILSLSFACFIFASFIPNQNMGMLMSLSLFFALVCDLTLLPLLLFDFTKD